MTTPSGFLAVCALELTSQDREDLSVVPKAREGVMRGLDLERFLRRNKLLLQIQDFAPPPAAAPSVPPHRRAS